MGPLKKYVTRKIAFLDPPCHFFSKAHHPHVIHEKVTNYGTTKMSFFVYLTA